MDLLRTAVVDITTLAATCRALGSGRLEVGTQEQRKLPERLRTELRRGTTAYIDTLARSKRGVLDEPLLASCRAAAEQQMRRSLQRRDELRHLMATEPGALAGVAAARQDLWRLAHMTIHLRQGISAMLDAREAIDPEGAKAPAGRLRRRVRRALIAYARVILRSKEGADGLIAAARKAALREIGKRGEREADTLGKCEAAGGMAQGILRRGVVKPLHDLVLDWRCPEM